MEMIQERTGLCQQPTNEWVDIFYNKLKESSADQDEFFFHLLPMKLMAREIIPYAQTYIQQNPNLNMDQLHEEIIDKCFMLGDYRQKKKNITKTTEEIRQLTREFLTGIFKKVRQFSHDDIQKAMEQIEHQLVILGPQEKVLFASKNIDGDYQDVIIILAHPDGTYDSIGRLSYTKDGHQKISRLFHYDDDTVDALRKNFHTN